jgi:WD40-like Beta Propeller Repeat
MKTKINTLLGAALSLLVTSSLTPAAPPGGGGGGNTGGGTIYYIGETDHGFAVMTRINSDGSGKAALGGGMWGNPSRVLYNNRRWFISSYYVIPDEYYPDGITKRYEVFALREDFHPSLNNNANTRVQLTDDITLQSYAPSPDWVPGGAQISFKGRRWSSAEPGATVTEGGIYTASLVFGADGNITGLAAQPATPAIPFPIVETTPGNLSPALSNHFCWNPAGDVVVYANLARTELWLADLLDVHMRIYTAAGNCDQPQWSPDGSTIVFRHGYGICTIKPDGTGFKVIVPTTSTWMYSGPYYSPTGSHIVYEGFERTTGNFDVFRATSRGDKRVNLTNTAYPLSEFTTFAGAGWR